MPRLLTRLIAVVLVAVSLLLLWRGEGAGFVPWLAGLVAGIVVALSVMVPVEEV